MDQPPMTEEERCAIERLKRQSNHNTENAMKADKMTPNPPVEVPEVTNYSQTKREALRLIGPDARVWHDEPGCPKVQVGREMRPGRLILGFGDDFQTALANAVAAHKG